MSADLDGMESLGNSDLYVLLSPPSADEVGLREIGVANVDTAVDVRFAPSLTPIEAGDDRPEYARSRRSVEINGRPVKVKLKNGKTGQVELFGPGDVVEKIAGKPSSNPAGEMVEAGHGFVVEDPRSRPWKKAKRTHCAYCAGDLPTPPVDSSKYRCEFDPELRGCKCSGCTLRWQVTNGHERNKGQPRMCCSKECTRLRDNERARWKRAVARAETRGEATPPEPEDRGLKLTRRNGPTSSVEGTGHRYVSANDGGIAWSVPRA